jgi:hypothetical protein
MNELKGFDAKLAREVRKELREAGKAVAAKVADEVRTGPPPNDNPSITAGTRRKIAAGVGVRVGTSQKGKGGSVKVVASGKALPANRKRMVKLWEREAGWRHPVFERQASGQLGTDSTVWVQQQGRPYFNPTIRGNADVFRAAVEKAMRRAAEALARRI